MASNNMNMKSLDDLTNQEFVDLTDDQINFYIDVQLMHNGLVKPAEPVYEEEIEFPEVPSQEYFVLCLGSQEVLAFSTMEEAQAAVAAKPMRIDYQYQVQDRNGNYIYYAETAEVEIRVKHLCTKSDVDQYASTLKLATSARSLNEDRRQDYDQVCSKYNEIGEDIRDQIYKARRAMATQDEIFVKFNKFVELAKGDKTTAARFILEAHERMDVLDMCTERGEEFDDLAIAIGDTPLDGSVEEHQDN